MIVVVVAMQEKTEVRHTKYKNMLLACAAAQKVTYNVDDGNLLLLAVGADHGLLLRLAVHPNTLTYEEGRVL